MGQSYFLSFKFIVTIDIGQVRVTPTLYSYFPQHREKNDNVTLNSQVYSLNLYLTRLGTMRVKYNTQDKILDRVFFTGNPSHTGRKI